MSEIAIYEGRGRAIYLRPERGDFLVCSDWNEACGAWNAVRGTSDLVQAVLWADPYTVSGVTPEDVADRCPGLSAERCAWLAADANDRLFDCDGYSELLMSTIDDEFEALREDASARILAALGCGTVGDLAARMKPESLSDKGVATRRDLAEMIKRDIDAGEVDGALLRAYRTSEDGEVFRLGPSGPEPLRDAWGLLEALGVEPEGFMDELEASMEIPGEHGGLDELEAECGRADRSGDVPGQGARSAAPRTPRVSR